MCSMNCFFSPPKSEQCSKPQKGFPIKKKDCENLQGIGQYNSEIIINQPTGLEEFHTVIVIVILFVPLNPIDIP